MLSMEAYVFAIIIALAVWMGYLLGKISEVNNETTKTLEESNNS